MTGNATVTLEPGPKAVGEARAAVAETARDHVDDDCLDTLRLLVSEVVTNSVRHAHTHEALEVSVCLGDDVVVAVTDRGRGFSPRRRDGELEDKGGWGLHLVEKLSTRWGVARDGFTSVWFTVPAH